MRTAVVILNWNTKEYLERFLPGLLASATDGTEIMVADSASTDGSMEMLSEKFPTVRQIRMDKNYGFTGGYNRAFNAVCELPDAGDLEYFVLINSDIEVPQDWLKPLTDWMDSHPDCAACAPKLHSWYEKDFFEYSGAAGGMLDRFGYPFCRGRVLKRVEKDNGQYDSPAKVFWATGACLMVRKTEYSKMGGLDDRFFAHMEEIDLCWRAHLQGWQIWAVPQSRVYHVGGGTLPNNSPRKLYLNYRNNLLMLYKNLPLKGESWSAFGKVALWGRLFGRKCFLFERMCIDGLSAMAYLAQGKFSYFGAVWRAHRDYSKMRRTMEVSPRVEGIYDKNLPGLYSGSIIAAFFTGRKRFSQIN